MRSDRQLLLFELWGFPLEGEQQGCFMAQNTEVKFTEKLGVVGRCPWLDHTFKTTVFSGRAVNVRVDGTCERDYQD